ncbi:2-polyprenyl-3-methyl-6-methoxy-1,4-benzoquinone monooxygenase [Undibacterium oligocarboniphilum]|uniref:3-demethoxyubiquinol 3-hydroxylase n=1 Tax=Undibacterium oligocarboniphilum TaxID=666702 RepID=A0A850QNH0_9BURK|nr:2-polyprenyl-3-methyl-6-methoxy-1,4-benzoquinone monooxygenase [Undibacterium oligocarboniphilum]MBC3869999.1 2-polyprenyl-3-methyl-6-methoxy-1,4-benzoquinone monooxygenase [Undibacterium oligocarboniphilum]NVO77616.1 2-polyprenyl-3-methyl-6-methoxy-1,4-benzoquinone monooxygenase [Undibacterium oligocarboniphilum]
MAFPLPDRAILTFDRALRTVTAQARSSRPYPAAESGVDQLDEQQKQHSAGLMRVNHVGEICAQALYDAQSAFSRSTEVERQLQHSCIEEEDHLAWTATRLQELNSHASLLNPLWYAGAYCCGVVAAKCGDAVSLGFVVETERQVEAHLAGHLQQLPEQDQRSRLIVEQMRQDEIEHGAAAQALGAREMPAPVRWLMKGMARVMTSTAYFI